MTVVDTATQKVLFDESVGGLNLGQMLVSRDGEYAYLPWMVYRQNVINPANIRKGWVLGSRIGRVHLDGPARREAITLDPPGMAVSDPYGLAISDDEQTARGYGVGDARVAGLSVGRVGLRRLGGPGDHIDRRLLHDPDQFYRVPLGGRPMAVRI